VEELFHIFTGKTPFAPSRKINALRNQLSREPDHFQNRLQLGDLFYRKGEWHAAVGEWQRALALQSQVHVSMRLGQTLVKLGQLDLAAAAMEQIRREDLPSVATAHYIDGWIAYSHRDAIRSAAAFQTGANLEPENGWHWRGLALAQRLAGRTPDAAKAIERALKLDAKDLVALSLGHEIWMADGNIEAAFHHAQQFLKLVPNDALTLRRLVDCRCHIKLTQGAAGLETRQLLRRTVRHSHNSRLMSETLAAFFLSQHDLKKALAVCQEFTRRHPQCPMGRNLHLSLLARSAQSDRLPAQAKEKKPAIDKPAAGICAWHEKAAPFCA
jgi:tetratricopeptide (TPR) repeat protein